MMSFCHDHILRRPGHLFESWSLAWDGLRLFSLIPNPPKKRYDNRDMVDSFQIRPGSLRGNCISRRRFLADTVRWAGTISLVSVAGSVGIPFQSSYPELSSLAFPKAFTSADEMLLEEIEKASFLFFWEQVDPVVGVVKDRSLANSSDPRGIGSIAATGFGLTALCIADERGWMAKKKLEERVRTTLRFFAKRAQHQHGFFYHWMNVHTAAREFNSEISSIDTAILLCGVLVCCAHFKDAEIRDLATQIYERVDWPWMLNGGMQLSHGWRPETGFIPGRWDVYCELMMIYLLGLGSSTHPLPAEIWESWTRPQFEYEGERFIGSYAPLFVHQYSQAWFDFRGKRDAHADFFENSTIATRVHKEWCLSLAKEFPDYSEDLWGITASDSAHGYTVWGGPPRMGPIDGTIVPAAAGGSLPFLPQDTLRVLRTIREQHGKRVWRRYGFVDAFNPLTGWVDPDVIGLNVGITLLMAENARTGFVWDTFMKNEEARRGMDRAGFEPGRAADHGGMEVLQMLRRATGQSLTSLRAEKDFAREELA
jgi:hypothetical protein